MSATLGRRSPSYTLIISVKACDAGGGQDRWNMARRADGGSDAVEGAEASALPGGRARREVARPGRPAVDALLADAAMPRLGSGRAWRLVGGVSCPEIFSCSAELH